MINISSCSSDINFVLFLLMSRNMSTWGTLLVVNMIVRCRGRVNDFIFYCRFRFSWFIILIHRILSPLLFLLVLLLELLLLIFLLFIFHLFVTVNLFHRILKVLKFILKRYNMWIRGIRRVIRSTTIVRASFNIMSLFKHLFIIRSCWL